LLVVGWLVGCWLLVVGCWLLVVGCWLLGLLFLMSGVDIPVGNLMGGATQRAARATTPPPPRVAPTAT
jgi:hypothetical protein